jgi:hypothetical protein
MPRALKRVAATAIALLAATGLVTTTAGAAIAPPYATPDTYVVLGDHGQILEETVGHPGALAQERQAQAAAQQSADALAAPAAPATPEAVAVAASSPGRVTCGSSNYFATWGYDGWHDCFSGTGITWVHIYQVYEMYSGQYYAVVNYQFSDGTPGQTSFGPHTYVYPASIQVLIISLS